jgi:hypothetical protein
MVQLEPFYRPKVLLLGNGINRAFQDHCSWNDLISRLSAGRSDPDSNLDLSDCPANLQIVLKTKDQVQESLKEHHKALYGRVSAQEAELLKKLLTAGFDDILTTNYSYELEAAAWGMTAPKDAQLKKSCRSIEEGRGVDSKYLLHSYQQVDCEQAENRIWHIHGEARKPGSMIIGYYYYAALINRIVDFCKSRGNDYLMHQKAGNPLPMLSWVDAFLLGDVYILGYNFDYCEVDLWWLLNRKKREKASNGETFFYEPSSAKTAAKQKLLETFGVKICNCGIEIPDDTADHSKDYQAFYLAAAAEIADKCKALCLA